MSIYPRGCTISSSQNSSDDATTKSLIEQYDLANHQSSSSSSSSRYPAFVDPDFPPNSHSLFGVCPYGILKSEPTLPTNTGKLPSIEWRTPKQWLNQAKSDDVNVTIFEEGRSVRPTDIRQGQLEDRPFLTSLMTLTVNSNIALKELIDMDQSNLDMGLFVVNICKDGTWKKVIVDSYFPCNPQGGPKYSYSASSLSCIWLQILEKAYAKYHGSYACIRNGSVHGTLIDLTGSPYREYDIEKTSLSSDIESRNGFFQSLQEHQDMKYLMHLSPNIEWIKDNHIQSTDGCDCAPPTIPADGYVYTLVEVKQFNEFKLCKVSCVPLNSPTRHDVTPSSSSIFNWTGDWSADDTKWNLLDVEKRDFFNEPNTFWISYEDFLRNFSSLFVCMYRHIDLNCRPWNVRRVPIGMNYCHVIIIITIILF